MKRRSSPFPPYVHRYRDRHGTLRSAFRRGAVRVPLPLPLLGPEWWEAYRTALAGRDPAAPSVIGAERTKPGTVAAGLVAYTSSAAFKNGLRKSTQTVYFNIMSRWRDQYGDRQLRQLQPRHIIGWIDERAETPAAARNFLKALRHMLRYCLSISLIETDPTAGIKAPILRGDGIPTWSDEEIEQYRRRHPLGTTARLALELLIGTALRRSDVVLLGRQHLRDSGMAIFVSHHKTGWSGTVPVTADPAQALNTIPIGQHNHLTFLITSFGAPFSSGDSFANAFHDWCQEAGLPPRRSPHGLRKAACRQLAEAGCTLHEIAAISGHLTLAEVQRYTKAVEQARLARGARAKTGTQIGVPTSRDSKNGT